jgi:hypothetical protein
MEPHDRRQDDALLVLVQTIQRDLQEMKQDLRDHIQTEPQDWANLMEDTLGKAFPAGADGRPDLNGHRSAHQEMIDGLRARREFWQKMVFGITQYGLLGFLGWLLYHAWIAFVNGPHK